MSVVALTVSSGCHVAGAAFKPTLLGNAALKHLGRDGKKKRRKKEEEEEEEEEEKRWLLLQEPLPDRSQHWRLCHLLSVGEVFKAKASG